MAKRMKNISSALRPDEEFVWVGMPRENKDCGRIDLLLLPVSAIFMALCCFFGVALAFAIRQNGFAASSIVSIVLLLIVGSLSFYSYFFRFSVKRKAKADVVYGVTNQGRVLIRCSSARRIFSFDSDRLADASITEVDRNGVGTIYLTRKGFGNLLDNTGLDFLGSGKGMTSALFDIDDCEEVYRLIAGEEE